MSRCTSRVSGFSQRTCLPASRERSTRVSWRGVGAAIRTASIAGFGEDVVDVSCVRRALVGRRPRRRPGPGRRPRRGARARCGRGRVHGCGPCGLRPGVRSSPWRESGRSVRRPTPSRGGRPWHPPFPILTRQLLAVVASVAAITAEARLPRCPHVRARDGSLASRPSSPPRARSEPNAELVGVLSLQVDSIGTDDVWRQVATAELREAGRGALVGRVLPAARLLEELGVRGRRVVHGAHPGGFRVWYRYR